MRTSIALIATALCAATLVASQPADCRQAHCPEGLGCNEDLPCPGDCGCVKRPGQPFGRCVGYDEVDGGGVDGGGKGARD